MSEQADTKKSLMPHIVIGVILLAVVLAVLLWPEQEAPEPVPVAIEQPQSIEPEPAPQPEPEPAPLPEPEPVELAMPEPEPEPEPEPLDISDATVKTTLAALTEYEDFSRLLVNDDLLQRFVVVTNSISEGDTAPNHPLLETPQKPFRVYQQAGKEWIDPASYKRYTPYVDVLDSMPAERLITLYQVYKPAISEYYAEIGDPDDDFNLILEDAINHLLDTPEIKVPVEVYTDSVMYKYRDDRLESLSAPQKQLLRTGPDNMRRIKAKLREIQQGLNGGGSR